MSNWKDGEIKQHLYDHGGSRIVAMFPGGRRELIADTYTDTEYAEAVRDFTERWITGSVPPPPGQEHTPERPLPRGQERAYARLPLSPGQKPPTAPRRTD